MTIWSFKNVKGVRAIDGDTVELVVDTGFRHAATVIVRLLGIDSVEKKQNPEKWATAREFTHAWLAKSPSILLECHGEDKYGGRWLGIVRDALDPRVSLNDALLDAKLAIRYGGGKKEAQS
jgi:endonuclease YncB( thermonuclease family)